MPFRLSILGITDSYEGLEGKSDPAEATDDPAKIEVALAKAFPWSELAFMTGPEGGRTLEEEV